MRKPRAQSIAGALDVGYIPSNTVLEMKTLEIRLTTVRTGGHRFDFFISGRPLQRFLPRSFRQLVPRLGGDYQPIDSNTRDLLLLEVPGDLPSGRVAFYVCPICGDYGCGVIGAFVVREGPTIVWNDFAYEPIDGSPVTIDKVGPFIFIEADYRKSIVAAVFPLSAPTCHRSNVTGEP